MNESIIKQFIFEKEYKVLRHVLFWATIFFFFPILDLSIHTDLRDSYETCAIMLPSCMIYTYVIINWLVPQFLITERYRLFALTFSLWIIIGMLLTFAFRHYLLVPFRDNHPATPLNLDILYQEVFVMFSFVVANSIAMFAVFIRIFKFWYIKQRQALQLISEKLSAELQLLKAQIHPHFLFNSLNSLYSLVLEKSDKAPEMLLKLSRLLSYTLYDCNATTMALETEVKMMVDYITLEQERYGDRLEVSLNISGDIPGNRIAPLLMLPLIENAFKHGASEQLTQAWISLDLSLRDHILQLNLINSKNKVVHSSEHTGIGIINMKKRLELLYPNKYELKMGDEGDFFYVSLSLTLNDRQSGTTVSRHGKLLETEL